MVKIKTKARRSTHVRPHVKVKKIEKGVSPIVLGAAAGCALGAVAAFLLTPTTKTPSFTQRLGNIYEKISDVAGDYAHEALEKGQKAYSSAKLFGTTKQPFFYKRKNINRNLILGIIGTGLLGASAIYALSQKPSHLSFSERWNASKWSELAKLVVDSVSDKLNSEEYFHAKKNGSHPVQNVINWAVAGLNFWQELQKRR